MTDLTEWVSIGVSAAATLAVGGLAIWSTRQDRARDRLHARLDSNDDATRTQGNRISTLEEHIRHLPTAESIGRLHEKMNEIGLQVAGMKGAQEAFTGLAAKMLEEKTPRRTGRG